MFFHCILVVKLISVVILLNFKELINLSVSISLYNYKLEFQLVSFS